MKPYILHSLMIAAAMMTAASASAAPIDADGAQLAAQQFINSQSGKRLTAPNAVMKLAHTEFAAQNAKEADYYVFNIEDEQGFVIVSGDDRTRSVLAYGDGNIDMKHIPANMQWLLDQYKRQMECLRSHPDIQPSTASTNDITIEPMITCHWGQGTPYNSQCPVMNGKYCYTGCVATSMAQVMYYWKYPEELPALPAYSTLTTDLSLSALPAVNVDWDNMIDFYYYNYTTAQVDAVATLMRYCGQACMMEYSDEGSGSNEDNKLLAMKRFGYNADAYSVRRDDCTAEQWDALLLEDLSNGRPVLYRGTGSDGGHAFVIDGCQGNLYHVNWGYDGSYEGYFSLDVLGNNYFSYEFNQGMLHNICPDEMGAARPAYDVEKDGIYYKIDGDEASVSVRDARFNSYSGDVVIPASISMDGKNYPVTAIGDYAFSDCEALTSVTMPNSITTTGTGCFMLSPNLKRVTLSENLSTLGSYLFNGCSSLSEVTIPSSVSKISSCAFAHCPSLSQVNINEGITTIEPYAFSNCYGLQELKIPSSVTHIDYFAFYLCNGLKRLELGDGNLLIDYAAFAYCEGLNELDFGHGNVNIGIYAFSCCPSLTEVTLTPSVKSIGDVAFSYCDALERVIFDRNQAVIGQDVFYACGKLNRLEITDLASWCGIQFQNKNSNPLYLTHQIYLNNEEITELHIPEGVTAIGSNSFAGGTHITSVHFPTSLNTIGTDAFTGCTSMSSTHVGSLKTWCGINFDNDQANPLSNGATLIADGETITALTIPAGVTAIGNNAFVRCNQLTSANIGNDVETIGDGAFYNCGNLTQVNIGDNVKSIGEKAFSICTSLTEVTLGSGLETLGSKAFSSSMVISVITCKAMTPPAITDKSCWANGVYKKAILKVPQEALEAYQNGDIWKSFVHIEAIINKIVGDVNLDGEVTISDVNALIDNLLTPYSTDSVYDVNGDGEIGIADVNALIELIMQQ